MLKVSLLTAALLAAGSTAHAQVGAGGQIQQIPPAPTPPKSIPELRIDRGPAPIRAAPAGEKIVVCALHVSGATRFTEAQLIAVADFQPGATVDLAGLRAMAARITAFYDRNGYFVAQAYLPAQAVADGTVTIAVVEGRYGKVALNNETHVSDGLARGLLSGLHHGDVVASAPLGRRLLLLSDLPGVTVASTLSPGEEVGDSNLLVDLTPGRRVTGSLQADNAGSRYTGQYRVGAAVNFNEPAGHGDVASLRVLTSGEGLTYVRVAYQTQIDALAVGGSYARLDYRLGKEFSILRARGSVDVASLYASYPLIRGYDTNLYVLANLDAKTFQDKVRVSNSVTDKTALVASLGLSGHHRDRFGGGGWTSYSVGWTFGDLDIKTPEVRAIDALTARTQGGFNKLSFEVDRLQAVHGPLSLYGQVRGQLASENLDTSEKMELGGAYGVRAYPEGEAYGDQGYVASLEARLALPAVSAWIPGDLRASAFVDTGLVETNRAPWTTGSNRRTLSAAGLGLTWTDTRDLMVKVSYAAQLGDEPALSAPDHAGRVWAQLTKLF